MLLEILAAPAALVLLAAVPLLAFFALRREAVKRERTRRATGPRHAILAPDPSPRRRRLRIALRLAGMTCAVLALARPESGAAAGMVEPSGGELVVVLDVSLSMLARDLAPDRLGAAKREVAALAEAVTERGGRIGLVAFAGEARRIAPLTSDLASFLDLLDRVDPWIVARGGTDLGAAIARGLELVPDDSGGAVDDVEGAALVVLSDGEDLEEGALRAASVARSRGVRVHAVAVGTTLGAKIPVDGPGGETWLREADGAEVVARARPEAARALAEATGGRSLLLDDDARPGVLVELAAGQVGRESGADDAGHAVGSGALFGWPLGLALALLLLELALGERRRR